MKLVCLDTCTKSLSIAAMEDGALLASRWHNANVNHSVLLMPMLSEMLETLGWDAKDVDIWAAVAGPGSFTGVRIGVSSVRALAHGWQKQVVSVNTLEALCMQAPMEGTLIAPMLDARRNQIYAAAYTMENGEPRQVLEPCADSIENFVELVKAQNADRVLFIGDGATAHLDLLQELGQVLPAHLQMPQASAAAALAYRKAQAGQTVTHTELEPIYLRKSQAERELEQKGKA